MNETIINGIDVSECKNFSCGICEEENKIPRTIGHFTADCTFYPNCYYKQLKRMQQELDIKEKMLDKFMIGSGETLEKLQKENEWLKKENEQLKKYIKNLQMRKDRYYLQVLEFERQISDWVTFYMKISDIISGNYEILDSQGLQDLRQIISEVVK